MRKPRFRHALLLVWVLVLLVPVRAGAGFSSLFVFGDGVCTTTDNTSGSALYYGQRYCNGRVWVEVLCQWQGIPYQPQRNLSYFGHNTQELVINAKTFVAPADVATSLFIVWCANADFVEFTSSTVPPYGNSNIPAWTAFIQQSIARHVTAISTLYEKGARTIILPNAADISVVPLFDLGGPNSAFVRQRVVEFNLGFNAALNQLAATKPGLVLHRPDVFDLFDRVLDAPSDFGMIHEGLDALSSLANPALNGPGANYVFWDDTHPTAKFQMLLADLAQPLIAPVRITGVARQGENARLAVANIPLGRTGRVEGSANLQPPWQHDATILENPNGGSTATSIAVPASGPSRFYRVSFPVVWTWP